MWTEVGTTDALELLGPTMGDSRVRSFAVKHLKRADDDVSMLALSTMNTVGLIWVGVCRNCYYICYNWCRRCDSRVHCHPRQKIKTVA